MRPERVGFMTTAKFGCRPGSCRCVPLRSGLVTAEVTGPAFGEVFTRRWVAETLLDLTGWLPERDLARMVLVESSCGSGAFLSPVVERLLDSARHHGRPFGGLGDVIRAYDLQPEHVEASRALTAGLLRDAGADEVTSVRLARQWVNAADFLLAEDLPAADVVVGNPPYIRYDDLTPDLNTAYRSAWPTMRGRGDIYVGFFERALLLLRPGGRVGFICADRWMRNQYGAGLRELVASKFAVEHIWSMHDVDVFETEVSAYPAITVLANQEQAAAILVETKNTFDADTAKAVVQWAGSDSAEFVSPAATGHRFPSWFAGDGFWPTGSPARLAILEELNLRFHPLHDPETGTKVSIGVATGADKTFITKNPEAVEADRLLPLAMRRDLMTGTFEWQGNYLINPWDDHGTLVPLMDYPRMAKHFRANPKLQERFVAKKSPRSWYRTIDKVDATLTGRPKLLLQDMKSTIHPVLDHGGFYPHHNLYYVVSSTWDMEVLGGLLLSRIAQSFIEAYCVRMRGGTLRFQAQYLKQIRVPRPGDLADADAAALRDAFRARDVDAATRAAARVYGINWE